MQSKIILYGQPWNPDAVSLSRTFDWIVVGIVFAAVTAGFHIHTMLTVGDWSFWVDWKDRQWWVTLTPILTITFPAALMYVFWEKFRLPLGATLAAVCLLFGEWSNRVHAFHMWSYFPLSLVWPETLIASALVLDIILMLTRNGLLTAIFGGMAFALLFYPTQWPMLAAYRLPMEAMGSMVSVGDYIGYAFTRTATPEYLRIIERGTLRTFGGHSATVSAFFSGFVCIFVFLMWWYMGQFFSKVLTVDNQLKRWMGVGERKRSAAAVQTAADQGSLGAAGHRAV